MSQQPYLNVKIPIEIHLSDWDEDEPGAPKNLRQAGEIIAKEYADKESNLSELLEISEAEYKVTFE